MDEGGGGGGRDDAGPRCIRLVFLGVHRNVARRRRAGAQGMALRRARGLQARARCPGERGRRERRMAVHGH